MTDNNRQEQTIKHLKEREQYRFKLRQGLRKSWSAVAKHKVLFLLLFILVFGFWVRVLPLELHAVESYVENIIDDAVHDRLLVEVHEQYPMISPDDKLAFAQKKLSEYKKTAEYKDQFTEIIAQFLFKLYGKVFHGGKSS